MKAILEFDLPEDREQFAGASKAFDFWNCLWEFDQYLRGKSKYEDNDLAQIMRDELWRILDDHNVTLEEYS